MADITLCIFLLIGDKERLCGSLPIPEDLLVDTAALGHPIRDEEKLRLGDCLPKDPILLAHTCFTPANRRGGEVACCLPIGGQPPYASQ